MPAGVQAAHVLWIVVDRNAPAAADNLLQTPPQQQPQQQQLISLSTTPRR